MPPPSPSDSAGWPEEGDGLASDTDGWLVERLVDLDPADRIRFAEQLRAVGSRLATRAEQYVRAFDGTLRLDLSRLLSRPAAVAVADLGTSAPPPLASGERVGAYRVVREIGCGGMGVVYLAERDDLGLRAALKVLDDVSGPAVPAAEETVPVHVSEDARRFHAERRHLARLSHPGVPRIYDAGQTAAGVPFYAMEFVDGVPLDEYVRDRGLGLVARLGLFVQLCEVVRYVHARGLAHGDLKPVNVLVQDGEPSAGARRPQPVVRLVDFGVAEETGGGPSGDVPTNGLRPFTLAYAAPEIYDGAPPSVAADVYALGVVLGELVASCPVRPTGIAGGRRQPGNANTIPLYDVVIWATRPSTAERYGSVDELLAEVREASVAVALASLPVVRMGSSLGETPLRSGGRAAAQPPSISPPFWAALAGAAAGVAVGWWSAR